ncbi:MAG TPA: hypothetical protein VLE20_03370 [Blastocatellia bacterium]|nr:hypothetical protein [Blastocatellia bacterium]
MENKVRPAVQEQGWLSNPKGLAVRAGILIAIFALGYIPSCVGARNAEERSAQLDRRLKLADLHNLLGMTSYEANRNNYANAAQMSTDFFNGLKELTESTRDDGLKQKLQSISTRRDEITTNLAQADPGVKEKLAQMYADFFQITRTEQRA